MRMKVGELIMSISTGDSLIYDRYVGIDMGSFLNRLCTPLDQIKENCCTHTGHDNVVCVGHGRSSVSDNTSIIVSCRMLYSL